MPISAELMKPETVMDNELYKKLMMSDVDLSWEYVLPRLESMPSSVILYNNGKKLKKQDR